MTQHEWTLLVIIITAGAFGGVVSYYGISGNPLRAPKDRGSDPDSQDTSREGKPEENPPKEPVDKYLFAPVIRGIAAAFLVPLFLNSVSSDFLKDRGAKDAPARETAGSAKRADTAIRQPAPATPPAVAPSPEATPPDTQRVPAGSGPSRRPDSPTAALPPETPDTDTTPPLDSSENRFSDYLLFAGTCLLASISSRAFIDSVSKRILITAQEAKEEAKSAKREAVTAVNAVKETEAKVDNELSAAAIAGSSGLQVGGGKSSFRTPPSSSRITTRGIPAPSISTALYNSDPNKGKFGGSASRNGYTVSAGVEALGASNLFFKVNLIVTADDPTTIDGDTVTFHLHPTFAQSVQTVPLADGRATLEIIATGAFTVGVDINGGTTKLEIDLSELSEAPKGFRER